MDLISKYELIEKIVQTENETILQQVKHLLEEEETESWETMDPALKTSTNRGLLQLKKGQLTPHNKVIKKINSKVLTNGN